MSAHDQNQDEREKAFDPKSEPSVAGNEPVNFSKIFFPQNARSTEPASGNDPLDPKNVVSGHQVGGSQPDQQFVKPTTGDFTRVFGRGSLQPQPAANEFTFNRREEPASTPASFPAFPETPPEVAPPEPGAFTRVFGKGNTLFPGQPNTSPAPAVVQPEAFSTAAPRLPVFSPEKDIAQPSSPLRGSFEERSVPAQPGGLSDIFQNSKASPQNVPMSRFPGLGTNVIPIGIQPSVLTPAVSPAARPPSDDLFVEGLNAVNLPTGPSEYTKIVGASASRSSQESAAPATPPVSQANAYQAQVSYQAPQMQVQMPQVQMPQMQVQTPQMQMPQMQVQAPQMQVQAPQMQVQAPQMQMPPVVPVSQPQLLPQDGSNSKWASYMPLIIAINVFLLVTILLIVIVFLASKK